MIIGNNENYGRDDRNFLNPEDIINSEENSVYADNRNSGENDDLDKNFSNALDTDNNSDDVLNEDYPDDEIDDDLDQDEFDENEDEDDEDVEDDNLKKDY